MKILSLLGFSTKLQATAHLRVLVCFKSRRLLKCLSFLLHAPLFLFALPAGSPARTTVLIEKRRIRVHDSKVSLTETSRGPYQLEIFEFEAFHQRE
jgi:hypothetical protein